MATLWMAVLVGGMLPWGPEGHRAQFLPGLPAGLPPMPGGATHTRPQFGPAIAPQQSVPVRALPPRMITAPLPGFPPQLPAGPPLGLPLEGVLPAEEYVDIVDVKADEKEKPSAQAVIRKWKGLAATASPTDDDKDSRVKRGAASILEQMSEDIDLHIPAAVFGLVKTPTSAKLGVDDVLAVASVTRRMEYDSGILWETAIAQGIEDVSPGDQIPVVDVNELVSRPGGTTPAVGSLLLHQIVRYASSQGRLTVLSPANAKLEEYYMTLGFHKVDAYGRLMVYVDDIEDEPDEMDWNMVNLDMK